jgi:hypothetical protein
MIPQIKIKSNRSMDKQNSNLYEQDCDIYDKNKYGITKINSKINNNLFNIILVDKKSENKKDIKKTSFLNISTTGINQETLGYKETKSENIDESRENLQNRMNSLFFNKNVLRKNYQDDNKNGMNNNSLILKATNKSINNINMFYNIQNGKSNDKLNIINQQIESNHDENDNNLSLTNIPNGNEDIKININDENKKDDNISNGSLKGNLNINNMLSPQKVINIDKNKENENSDQFKFKLKVSKSFNSFPNNLSKDNDSEFQIKNEKKRKKSIISQYVKNYNPENIFGSLNDVFESLDIKQNKEYNFTKKEIKRYKNIEEIKEDKNYFRFLYLSSNIIDIIKKKKKYQMNVKENKKKNSITDISNQNYYIYTNDRNVLKLTALYFQKVKKAIFLFNTGKFENSYNSLLEDKIIKNKSDFALFLLIVQGIDKDKLYLFLTKDIGINNNFCLSKLYLSFFNFSNQTVIISFNFLLEAINIPSKNNDNIISLFTEAYLRDNSKLNVEFGKGEIKKVCRLVLKLNNIMNDPDEDKQKNKEEFINSNINDETNWNPNLNTLISKDPSKTSGFLNYSHICGFVFDEYIKNENSIPQQKYNKRTYKELLNKKLLVNNKSFSYTKSLITNDKNNLSSNSKLMKIPEIRKKNISIIANNKVLFKSSNFNKKYEQAQHRLNSSKEEKEIEKNFKSIINTMKKGEKFKKITNVNGKTIKMTLILTTDENNIILKNEICCTRKQILSVDEISDCNIGYFQYLKTNKNFENYMTIILNTEVFYEFYHSNKKVIQNWINALETLIQKRNKILAAIYKKEKISEEEISNIWQNEFLPNWSFYRKYVIKKRNKVSDNEFIYKPNDDKRKTKLFKIWSLGLPFWLRENMWKIIVGNELNISLILFQGYFNLANDEYEKCQIDKNIMINGCSDIIEEEFNEIELIFKDCDKIIHRFKKNIKKDFDISHFQKEIYKIVRSFCFYRPDILYSKIISEFAVIFYYICSKNEFDTFIILSNFLINNYFFSHIQNDTLFLKNQLKFFEFLIEKYLPLIHMHFKELQFNANIFFYKWIEFLFLKTFNFKLCLRIIDYFLIKGHIVIFEVSLATLNILKKDILNLDEDGLVILLKKNIINLNEEALFKYIDSLDITKEYNDYFNADIFGKEKLDLFQDL